MNIIIETLFVNIIIETQLLVMCNERSRMTFSHSSRKHQQHIKYFHCEFGRYGTTYPISAAGMDKDYTVPIGKAKVRNPIDLKLKCTVFYIYYVLEDLKLSVKRMIKCATIA